MTEHLLCAWCTIFRNPHNNPEAFWPFCLSEFPTQGYPVGLGFEHRTNSGACVLLISHSLPTTDSANLLGPLPMGLITGGRTATLLKMGRCPESAGTSSEASASTDKDAGEHLFSSMGVGWGSQEDLSLVDHASPLSLFSPLQQLPGRASSGPWRGYSCLLDLLLPTQLSAPAAPWPPAVGPPPFGATCHSARTPAGADPKGLGACLLALRGCLLGWGQLGPGTWPGGAGQPE